MRRKEGRKEERKEGRKREEVERRKLNGGRMEGRKLKEGRI